MNKMFFAFMLLVSFAVNAEEYSNRGYQDINLDEMAVTVNGPSCSVDSITSTCRNGAIISAAGCSISCEAGQFAHCKPGKTYINSCESNDARCWCGSY